MPHLWHAHQERRENGLLLMLHPAQVQVEGFYVVKMRVLAQRGVYVVEVPESVGIGDLITLTQDEYGRAENIQIGQPYKKARKDARTTAHFQSRLMPKQYGMAGIFRLNQVDV